MPLFVPVHQNMLFLVVHVCPVPELSLVTTVIFGTQTAKGVLFRLQIQHLYSLCCGNVDPCRNVSRYIICELIVGIKCLPPGKSQLGL